MKTEINVELEGTNIIYAEDKDTGEIREVVSKHNTIQTAGFDHMLDLLGAFDSTNYMDNASTDIDVQNGSDTTVFSQAGCESGYPSHSTIGQVSWRWKDTSTDTYTVDDIYIEESDGSHTFSSNEGMTSFDGGDNTSDLSKPASENWIYVYQLTCSGGGAIVQNNQWEGEDMIVRALTDNLDTGETFLGSSGARALVTDTSDSSEHVVGLKSGPTRPSTTSIEWVFEDSGNTAYSWDEVEVQESGTNFYRLRDDSAANLGNKGSNDTFEWTYTLSVS